MKKIAIAAAGLSLLGLGACVSPAYAPYYGNAEGHDGHGDSAYYVTRMATVSCQARWLVVWLVWPRTRWLTKCWTGLARSTVMSCCSPVSLVLVLVALLALARTAPATNPSGFQLIAGSAGSL